MRKVTLFFIIISVSALMFCGCSSASQIEASKAENAELSEELEEAKSELMEIQSELEQTKRELEFTKSELETVKSELEAAESSYETAEASETESDAEDVALQEEPSLVSGSFQSEIKVKDVHEESDGSVTVVFDNGKEYKESSIDVNSVVGDALYSVKYDYNYEAADLDGDGSDEVLLVMLIVNNFADGMGEGIIIDIAENGEAVPVITTASEYVADTWNINGGFSIEDDHVSYEHFYKENGELVNDSMIIGFDDGKWILEKE